MTVNFVRADWLGTERVRTNMAGQVCESITSEPFGEDVVTSTPSGVTGCHIHLQTVPGRLGGRGDLPKDQINPSTP